MAKAKSLQIYIMYSYGQKAERSLSLSIGRKRKNLQGDHKGG